MKKYVTVSLISALIMTILGSILIFIGIMCGGVTQARDEIRNNLGNLAERCNVQVFDNQSFNIVLNDEWIFDSEQPVHVGKYSNMEEFGKDEVTSMVLCMAAGTLDVEVSENEYYGVEGSSEGGFQYYVEDGVLYLLAISSDSRDAITIYLPSDCNYNNIELSLAAGEMDVNTALTSDELEIELGAGSLSLESISCNNIITSVGAGNVDIYKGTIQDGNFDVAAGALSYNGEVLGDIKGSCAAGSICIYVDGTEEDFDYDISAAMGGVTVGSYYAAGLGADKNYNNNALQEMELETAMGYIEVSFY